MYLVAEDGGNITLGDTTVSIILTPGHTPGAYSLIFQAKDRGQPVTVAYASGTAMQQSAAFFPEFIASQRKMAASAAKAGATVLLSNHTAFDGGWVKARMAAWRDQGQTGVSPLSPSCPRYFDPMTSRSLAVSTYCWNLVTLPSFTSQTWQTCVSMLLPVGLNVPL
jgi:hypothetical protein